MTTCPPSCVIMYLVLLARKRLNSRALGAEPPETIVALLPSRHPAELLDELLVTATLSLGDDVGQGQIDEFDFNAFEDGRRLYLLTSQDFFDEDGYEVYESLEQEFRSHFETAVRQIENAWGSPDFRQTNFGYPDNDDYETAPLHERLYWSGALALAAWFRDGFLAYIELEHHDKELPLMLILGTARPRPADAIYRR